MKAAVMTEFQKPLEIQSLPDPSPGPTDAVIKVEACGICRSDWHLWQHDWTWVGVEMPLPRVPGHEFGGVVEAVGKEVRNVKPGDRVTVPFHLGCGRCQPCLSGHSNQCYALGFIGVHHHGGYGELSLVPNADSNLVKLPDEVDSLSAAALGCRFMTSYHGIVDRADVRQGEWVAIYGIGGVGLAAVQIASAIGARVIAISRSEDKLAQALAEGATATVKANDGAPSEAVLEITKGGADVTIDALGTSQTIVEAIKSLKKGGRHLQLGLTGQNDRGQIALPIDMMVFRELSVISSVGCPTTSYPGLLGLVARGKLQPSRLVDRAVSVDEVNTVLGEMTDYRTRGFNVINVW